MSFNNLAFHYKFKLERSKQIIEHDVRLIENEDEVITNISSRQKICLLETHKCSHCPLSQTQYKYCPVALRLTKLISKFEEVDSFEPCEVIVETENRNYSKHCDVQKGLQSIFGPIIAFSGCPHTDFLKSMGKYHLPFSDNQETLTRVLSFYLLENFVNKKTVDPNLSELKIRYENLSIVNSYLLKRISDSEFKDASKNAIVILETFSQLFKIEYDINFEDLINYL